MASVLPRVTMRASKVQVLALASSFLAASFLAAVAAGCSSGPSDIAGTYSGTVTNGPSTCLGPWSNGQSAQVSISVVQSDSSVSFRLTGVAAQVLGGETGPSQFDGTIDKTRVEAHFVGSTPMVLNECRYTINGVLSADFAGEVLTGSVTYTRVTNNSPDCGAICSRRQTFVLNRL